MQDVDEDLLRRAYRKRKAGHDLTDDERQALSRQQQKYAGRRTPLYVEDPAQLQEWKAIAKGEGYTVFSAWVVAQVKRSLSGQVVDAIEHGKLLQRLEHMEGEVDYHRRRSRGLEEENKALRGEVRRLTSEIADLTRLISERLGGVGES